MKAAICTAYGLPEVLEIREVEKPRPKDNEVLVKIMAAAVNSGDARIRGFRVEGIFRILMRFVLGFKKPRNPILGMALSGVVEEVGATVSSLRLGDAIFASTGFKSGAYAEYTTVAETANILPKPEKASFEEAAALLFGGMSALYFLEKAGIASMNGQSVLIYGATGSVGAAAVQIAKHYGARVTAVCGEQGVELAQKLGSDTVVIYTRQDFTQLNERFDMIFDAVGKIHKKACKKLLNPNGKYSSVGGMDIAKETRAQMAFLKQRYDEGQWEACIDKIFTLDNIVEAHRYVDTDRKKANVVIKPHG